MLDARGRPAPEHVDFDSQDHYIVGTNGNDGGSARYRRERRRWRRCASQATRDLALYAIGGPRLRDADAERARRTVPTGRAGSTSRCSRRSTAVSKWAPRRAWRAACSRRRCSRRGPSDEIVTATNIGGRATFQNAGRTAARRLRAGVAARDARTTGARSWPTPGSTPATATASARASCPCTAAGTAAARQPDSGHRPQALFASYGWVPPQGWRAGTELRARLEHRGQRPQHGQRTGYAVVAVRGLSRAVALGPERLRAHRQPVRPVTTSAR